MRRTDELIKQDVVAQLVWDGRVNAADVNVEVLDGVVTLNGTVPSYRGRNAAESAAGLVAGVTDVLNNLSVALPEQTAPPTDADIKTTVDSRFAWTPEIAEADISTEVNTGVVTLKGNVTAYWQKLLAEDIVSYVRGVLGIENELAVVSTENFVDQAIADDIVAALDRSLFVNPTDVDVKVTSGVVTLSGSVASPSGREAALAAARYTAGVVDVVDDLMIVEPEPAMA
jgi:osmotically-inducible protein OsmY